MKNLTFTMPEYKKAFLVATFATLLAGSSLLTACDEKKTEEPPTDTLKVAMDTPKVIGNGTGGEIKVDTMPVKPETTAVVKPPVTEPTNTVKGQDNTTKNTNPDKPKEIKKVKPPKEQPADDKDIVTVPDELAAPAGGYPAFYKGHVKDNLKYPEQALKEGVEGRVALQFIVGKDGSISNVKVTQGIGAGCDEEAVRILKQSPKWQPAVHQGKAVKSKGTIFISFKIK